MKVVKDLVSIIIPVFNVEKYVPICIESVINQTYKNIEILLIDDGSTDGSGKICDEYAKNDERICVFHKSNGGLSDARNYALDRITGEYIYFVDSDDYINYQCIETLVNLLKCESADIVSCAANDVFENESRQFEIQEKPIVSCNNIEACLKIRSGSAFFGVAVWNKLYKRNLFDNIRFPKGLVHEDQAVIYQLVYQVKKYVHTYTVLHYYRVRTNSITRQKFTVKRFDFLKALKMRTDFLKDKNEMLYEKNLYLYLHMLVYYRYIAKHKFKYGKERLKRFELEIKSVAMRLKAIKQTPKLFIMYRFYKFYGWCVYIKNLRHKYEYER